MAKKITQQEIEDLKMKRSLIEEYCKTHLAFKLFCCNIALRESKKYQPELDIFSSVTISNKDSVYTMAYGKSVFLASCISTLFENKIYSAADCAISSTPNDILEELYSYITALQNMEA